MTARCIKYRLTADGRVPDFLCTANVSVGGVYGIPDPATPAPRDTVFVGLTLAADIGDSEVVASQAELAAYLTSVSAGWGANDPMTGVFTPFNPAAEAARVWAALTAVQRLTVPSTVTMRQARLALLQANLLAQVNTAITNSGDAAKIEWEYAQTVDRNSALVQGLTAALGLTESQLDALFTSAASL